MVRLTSLLRRAPGMTPAGFHDHWRKVHGPLVAGSHQSGSHVVRCEQHPRPLWDCTGDDDPGYDGVTVQWFASIREYQPHSREADIAEIWADIATFLDVDRLEFVLTEDPRVVIGDAGQFPQP